MRGSREPALQQPALQLLTPACTEGTEQAVVGEEFRRVRRKTLKLSQAKLANRLGVTATSVARWERNERPISEMAARFVRLLAEIETKAGPDLAARVARLLPTSTTRRATTRTRTRKRTS